MVLPVCADFRAIRGLGCALGVEMTFDQWIAKWVSDRSVEVLYTKNRCILINCTSAGHRTVLRVHRVFRDAPQAVARAVVGLYIERPTLPETRRSLHAIINEYIDSQESRILRDWATTIDLSEYPGPKGRYVDLGDRMRRLNRKYFDGELSVFMSWSKNIPRRSMGTWVETPQGFKNVVTINRALDAPRVPLYVIDEVIHHEMLHEAIPAVKKNGRRYRHTPEFRRRERAYPDFSRADDWVRGNWERLIDRQLRREG